MIESLRHSLHIMIHPFDGFFDLKYEKKGSIKASLILLLLLILSRIFKRQAAGFIFSSNNIKTLNIMYEFRIVLISIMLWCIANWCLTTLMDGEGSFKDIFMATAYSVTPMIVIYMPLTIAGNFLLMEEAEFYRFFEVLAVVWFVWLLWIGIMTVHQYSVKKTVFTIFLTLAGMGIIIFISMISLHLFEEVSTFAVTVFTEIFYRQ